MPLGGVVVPPKIHTIKNFIYSSLIYLLKSSPELQFFSSANFLSFSRSSLVSLNLKTSALSFIFLLPFINYKILRMVIFSVSSRGSPNHILSSGRASFATLSPARFARMLIKAVSENRSKERHGNFV